MPEPLPDHELRRLRHVAERAENPEAALAELIERRQAGEPLQYLEGTAPFGPLELVVDERVLIPRPETEQLWELARSQVERPRVIVDLCTGSGALALGLKHDFPGARVLGTDLSPEALEVARENARRLGLEVELVEGDLFSPLPEQLRGGVDLVVANPPYVAAGEWEQLPADVRREPREALVAGPQGSEVLDRVAAEVAGWLAPGGLVVCEIGETQGARALAVFGEILVDVDVHRDLAGRERFVTGRRPAAAER